MTPDIIENVGREVDALKARTKEQQNGHKPTEDRWPLLAPEAFHGLAGKIVKAIEPHTEADNAAILISLLVAFGNACNSAPHAIVEDTKHPANLFAVLVGDTAMGRKGTAWKRAEKLMRQVDELWAKNCVMGGLSSGEGLISTVRDPSEKKDESGKPLDQGVADKRLLVVEEEFASTLKVMGREGNILSTIIRQAWDGNPLRVMTRVNPLKATGAHISIIGHCTSVELRKYLNDTESANGFGNRFLWACVRRSKALPEGGGVPQTGQYITPLFKALQYARSIAHPLRRSTEARYVWNKVYSPLTDGGSSLVDCLTGRAAPQVLRLSLLYALLDQATEIGTEHLLAALAIWDYCDASARIVFGGTRGDGTADKIVTLLHNAGTDGATSTEITNALGNNVTASEKETILEDLLKDGVIVASKEMGERGRSVNRYRLVAENPLIRKFVKFAPSVAGATYVGIAKMALETYRSGEFNEFTNFSSCEDTDVEMPLTEEGSQEGHEFNEFTNLDDEPTDAYGEPYRI